MKSFTEIFNENKTKLTAYIRKRIIDEADVSDILQDVFMRLFMQEDISIIDNISSWLYRTTDNRITDFNRKKREVRMPQISSDDEDEEASTDIVQIIADETGSVEKQLIRTLVWDELGAALSELPDEQREVFEKTELDGMSFKELSEQSGVPINTLLSRKHYAVKYLRNRLNDMYEDFLTIMEG